MIYARNSDNKYEFISLIFRHLHLLFKQWMLPEKKSGFFPQHDKGFMQLKQRDILGNYAEKNGGTARIALLINSPLFAKLRGVLRKCGTGSHAPDRSIKIPRRQSPLCANNGIGVFPHFRRKKARPEANSQPGFIFTRKLQRSRL